MGLLDRWDESNQRRAEADNEAMGGDDWAERLNEQTPGPDWAWKLHAIPGLGWIGAIAIGVSAIARRSNASTEKRPDQ